MPVETQERKRGDEGRALVAIYERMRLGDAEGVSCGNVEGVRVRIGGQIHRPHASHFKKCRIPCARRTAVTRDLAVVDDMQRRERNPDPVTHARA